MRNRIGKLVVFLFVLSMFLLMTVSAKAQTGNCHFFNEKSFTSGNSIELQDITVTRSGFAGVRNETSTQQVFGTEYPYYIFVDNNEENHSTTELTFESKSQGVLLVYYAMYQNNDLMLDGQKGDACELDYVQDKYSYGINYFILDKAESYTLSSDYQSKVYGFVFMPGNVAAYDVMGKGDLDLIGGYCDSYDNLEKPRQVGNMYLEGWYKDANFNTKVTNETSFKSPSVIFAKWVRCVWDLSSDTDRSDGIEIVHYAGASSEYSSSLDKEGFNIFRQESTTDIPYIRFVPQYDGDLTVTFNSNSSTSLQKKCVIGTALPSEINPEGKSLSVGISSSSDLKTVHAKLRKGQECYIYTTTGNIRISKLQYTAGASSAQVNEDRTIVTLTTTDNMEGWRAFYDAVNSYTADEYTKVYIVEQLKDDGKVNFVNRTGQTIPAGCPVVLHTENKENGSYTISLTITDITDDYTDAVQNNILSVSSAGESVSAYRLGYRAGDGYGVAFYQWTADNPNAGIVYLDKIKLNGNSESAKISFNIEDEAVSTGIVSIDRSLTNKVYSLSGQQLITPVKGINIVNGKKVVVR